jgi:NTE family protein
VERDGRLLVDGGLVEPVPFKTAKELGAELVIGVNLSADVIFEIGKHIKEQRRWKPWQVFLVLDDALSVIEHQLAMEQKDKDDIMLTPRIGHISTIDFHKVDEGIQAGIEEVSAWRHEILKRAEIPHKIGLFERFFGSQTD